MSKVRLYGGIRMGDEVIGVTHIPNRKSPCLYYQNGCVLYPLAYFTKEEHAEMFWEQFQRFVFGTQPNCYDCVHWDYSLETCCRGGGCDYKPQMEGADDE